MWKDYDDKYEVSINGEVRNKKTQRILKPYMKHNGYLAIDLWNKNEKKKWRINRLMLHVWSPCENMDLLESHHINHNRTDNRLCNLMWTTKQENIRYRDERKKQKHEQLWVYAF